MHRRLAWLVVALAIFAVGCGGASSGGGGGQIILTRTLIATGLAQPMQYNASPDDPALAYVLERAGVVRVIQNDVLLSPPVLDLSGVVVTDGECGLQGMAFAPDFASSRAFYLTYNTNEGGTLHTRVDRFTMSADGLTATGGGTHVFYVDQPYTNHKGGTIRFRDGYLYLGLGDGGSGNDPDNRAQDPQSLLGKMLRIDPAGDDFPGDPDNNYAIPASNPFVGVGGVRGEIWDFGMRNPFRWSVDAQTGALTIADVGQDAYEEVDFEPVGSGGRNYGWRQREGKHATGNGGASYPLPFTDPYLEYPHPLGRAIVGGFIVRSAGLGLDDRYLMADYETNHLWSAPAGPGDATMADTQEIIVTGGWNGIVSIDPDANGQPVVVELNTGNVWRLTP